MIMRASARRHAATAGRRSNALVRINHSAPGTAMKLNLISEEAGVSRLQTEGEIRLSEQPMDPQLLGSLLGPDCYQKKILLDMSRTPYIDSSGVSWLVNFHKKCHGAKGILVVHSVPPSIMSILKLLHIDRYLNIVEDESAAQTMALGGKS